MITVTDKYINSLCELMHVEFPEHIILQAKKCLLDYIGVTFAGATIMKEKGNVFLDKSEIGNISIIGFGRKCNLYNAALINGMSAHIADIDDGIRQGNFHPGAPIISALLSIVQQNKLSAKRLLYGLIIGYEASIRLACAIQPSHRNKGYHAMGTCGTIGVALGVGAALEFSKQQMKNALSAAATSSSGMLNVIKGISELKPYNSGQAAVSGIIAALIAQAGFNGPSDVLMGKWGFINMITDKSDLNLLENLLDGKYGVEKVYRKLYASCRHSHPAIEAILSLKKKYNIKVEQINEIIVETYHLAANASGHTSIDSISDAKMSIPFSIAVALITGEAGINQFTNEKIKNKDIISLSKKVIVIESKTLNAFVPEKRPAVIKLITLNKEHFSFRVDLAKGEPENSLSNEEVEEKFLSLTLFAQMERSTSKKIINHVWNIETDLNKLLQII